MTLQSENKLAVNRLKLLEFAEALGNVAEVYRRKMRISRTQFYVYKHRCQQQGLEDLKDLPLIHKVHSQTISPEVVDQIIGWAYKQPSRGL